MGVIMKIDYEVDILYNKDKRKYLNETKYTIDNFINELKLILKEDEIDKIIISIKRIIEG